MEMSLVNDCDNEMIGLYDDYFKDETIFCEAFDKLFNENKYKRATENDIGLFKQYLQNELFIDDNEFVNQLLFTFSNKLNVETIRRLSHAAVPFYNNTINIMTAFTKLKELYDKLVAKHRDEDKNIIAFLMFLLFEPIEHLRTEHQHIHDLCFHPTVGLLNDMEPLTKRDIYNGRSPCVLSYICSNSCMIHELFNNNHKHILLPKYIPDVDQFNNDYFENMFAKIYESI